MSYTGIMTEPAESLAIPAVAASAASVELLADAPAGDPTWQACLAPVGPRTLLAFDYDGTLAPIVTDITAAWMTDTMQAAVMRLLGLASSRVAIVSGRESDDVRRYFERVLPLAPGFIVGNHGADHLEPAEIAPRLAVWQPILAAAVAKVPGAELEPKSLGFSLHWRQSADPALAERVLGEVARSLQDAQVIDGKFVFNVLPKEAPHKGHALAELAADGDFDHVLFVGDDVTDELAFAHAYALPFTGIRVGKPAGAGTKAAYWVRDQRGVEELLRRLTALLKEQAPAQSVGSLAP